MATEPSTDPRPITTYLAAQVLSIPLAGVVAWSLYSTGAPVWLAVIPWLLLSAYLSRKRQPLVAIAVGLQVGAVVLLVVPLLPYVRELRAGASVTAVDIATGFIGPAAVFALGGAVAYLAGTFLKRRAKRKRARRARKVARVQG